MSDVSRETLVNEVRRLNMVIEALEFRLGRMRELALTLYDGTNEWHAGCRKGELGNEEATCGYGETLDQWDALFGVPD